MVCTFSDGMLWCCNFVVHIDGDWNSCVKNKKKRSQEAQIDLTFQLNRVGQSIMAASVNVCRFGKVTWWAQLRCTDAPSLFSMNAAWVEIDFLLGLTYNTVIIPSRLVDVLVQSGFDFIIGQEGHVAGVCHCQEVPVPQNWSPRLKKRPPSVTLYKHCTIIFHVLDNESSLGWLGSITILWVPTCRKRTDRGRERMLRPAPQPGVWEAAHALRLVVFSSVYSSFEVVWRTRVSQMEKEHVMPRGGVCLPDCSARGNVPNALS